MIKRTLYHLVFALLLLLIVFSLLNKLEKFNPVVKAIKEVSLSDIYFSYIKESKISNDIYIVDIGLDTPKNTRVKITDFINQVNSKYKPTVIGVDVFFENKVDEDVDFRLSNALSENNVIRIFKIIEKEFNKENTILYPDFGSLPNLDTNTVEKDGYTFGLGDATDHPCIRYFKPKFIFENTTFNHFSSLVAKKYLNYKKQDFDNSLNLNHKMMINYSRDFSNNRISIDDSSRYKELKGKIVLLGINTYKNDGFPLYNDDVHYTPKNRYYIGRSEKDSYGIEILAQIISNFIHLEHLSFKEDLMRFLNIFISLISYLFLLYIFICYNKYFVIFKVFFQTIGVLFLAVSSIVFIHYNNFYIDLTLSIAIMFISAPIIELVEEILQKINNRLTLK